MTIIGHGIDLVEISRVARLADVHGDHFLSRVFTDLERQIIAAAGRHRDQTLAGRFAAKEAVLKALGTGWRGGIAWTDVEILKLPTGAPSLRLHAESLRIANALGVTAWSLSITHTATHALASAIAT